jgi:hypothetical protein
MSRQQVQPPAIPQPPPTIHQVIYDALNVSSPACAHAWNRISPIIGMTDDMRAIQIANQFWRIQISSVPGDTRHERMCLVDTMRPSDWQYDFVKYVVPLIVANQLPKIFASAPL